MLVTNAPQVVRETEKLVLGRFESRTPTSTSVIRTSTQLSLSAELKLLLNHPVSRANSLID
jgi:hypothetical protein